MKSAEEIMKILEAHDLTGSLRVPGSSLAVPHQTVKRYVDRRAVARPQLIDPFLPKVEEWVERSEGKVLVDAAQEKLLGLGYTGSERTTRRAVE